MQGFTGPTKSKPAAKVLLFPELRKKKRNFLGKRGCFYEFWGRIVQFEGIQSARLEKGSGLLTIGQFTIYD
jgi:hypothetical protein